MGAGNEFIGIIDVIEKKYAFYTDVTTLRPGVQTARCQLNWADKIPDGYQEKLDAARKFLLDELASRDDDLAMRYLEGEEISVDEIKKHLRRAVCTREIFPVNVRRLAPRQGDPAPPRRRRRPPPLARRPPRPRGDGAQDRQAARPQGGPRRSLSGLAFKTIVDEQGTLTFVRVYSGKLSQRDKILNARKNQTETVGRLYQMHADKKEPIESAEAGAICAIVGAKTLVTGDTVCDPNQPITYTAMNFAKPVISLAITPKSNEDRDKLANALAKYRAPGPDLPAEDGPGDGRDDHLGHG